VTTERDGGVRVALDDPEVGEPEERLESGPPQPVLEGGFRDDGHAAVEQHAQYLEEER
jgi:hypothetical protein